MDSISDLASTQSRFVVRSETSAIVHKSLKARQDRLLLVGLATFLVLRLRT